MEKVINDYLVDLALDLKITVDTEMSTAELTRCVARAVADLTRFRPRQKSKEFIVDATVSSESFTSPAAADEDYFVDNKDISASSDDDTCTLAATSPDVARPVKVTVTDADLSISELIIIVKGYGANSEYITEHFFLAGGLIQTGSLYFAVVSEVEIDKIAGNGASDTLDVGTATHEGVFVQLANRPIKFNTDSVSGTTRYTDYIMDYIGGRVALKASGGMSASTAYTINYTKNKVMVDISSLKDLVRIASIEYPEGSTPAYQSTFEVWGDLLMVTSMGTMTQAEATDDEHLLVYYLAEHSPPSASSPGSYPSFLDYTVELAAFAYALFIRALEYEQEAVTDITNAGTELTATTAIHTLAAAALAKVAVYLETHGTTDNAKEVLANITDDIAALRTATSAALDAAAAYLAEVDTTDLGRATEGAEALLDTGRPLIDQLNDGENVPALHAEYAKSRSLIAQARTQAAMAFAQEAVTRIGNLRTYIEEAGGWNRIAEDFISEGNAQVAEIDRHLSEANLYQTSAEKNMLLADRYRAEAIERRNEAWAIWGSPEQYAPQYSIAQRSQPK